MRPSALSLAAVLCAAASARALDPPPRQAKLDELRHVLTYGLWNGRIDALYDLGDVGRDGLPLIVFAGDDADWQVRLTAVHFLGKIGAPAAADLGEVARREPCPQVRLFALLWLARLGPAGRAIYEDSLTTEDEDALARLPPRYTPGRMGKSVLIDPPGGEMTAEFFNFGPDFRVCASSEHAGRLHRHLAWPRGGTKQKLVVTADVPRSARRDLDASAASSPGGAGSASSGGAGAARAVPDVDAAPPGRREAELDKILAGQAGASSSEESASRESVRKGLRIDEPAWQAAAAAGEASPGPRSGARESLPPGAPGSEPRFSALAGGGYGAAGGLRAEDEAGPAPAPGTRESMPPGEPGPAPRDSSPAAGRFEEAPRSVAPDATVAAVAPSRPRESFPPGAPAPELSPEPAAEAPRALATERPGPVVAAVAAPPAASTRTREAFPPGLAAPVAPESERPTAAFVPDAGTGKVENDPIPELIKQLSSAEPARRARAADELGKRGAVAVKAVRALRRALRDKDRRVRASAVLALGSVGGAVGGVDGDLRGALRDKDEDVRFSARIALERIKESQ